MAVLLGVGLIVPRAARCCCCCRRGGGRRRCRRRRGRGRSGGLGRFRSGQRLLRLLYLLLQDLLLQEQLLLQLRQGLAAAGGPQGGTERRREGAQGERLGRQPRDPRRADQRQAGGYHAAREQR